MADVVIAEFMDQAAVDGLARRFHTLYEPALADDPVRLAETVAGARALIVRNRTQVRGALLAAAGALRAVGRLGVGLDNIDLEACRARGIAVLPATGANVLPVAEYVVTGVLMLLRGAYHATPEILAGRWPRRRLMGREASGSTLGLVGFGAIGRATALRARALGMRVVGCDPHVPPQDPVWTETGTLPAGFEELLAASDAVSLHVPLDDSTRHLVDAAALARMKPGAVLINAARGGVVDETALARALRDGHLGGAMLDVFENEPLPAGSVLAGVPGLVLTPHIAGVTEESNQRVSAMVATRVAAVLEAAR